MATETDNRSRRLADLEAEMNAIAMPDDWSPELEAPFRKVFEAITGDGSKISADVDMPTLPYLQEGDDAAREQEKPLQLPGSGDALVPQDHGARVPRAGGGRR